MGTIAAERGVHFFEPPHEIAHFIPSVRPSRSGAEMRAASEWTRVIDDALADWIQHRAAARFFIAGLQHYPPASRAQCRGGDERLACGEHRSPSRQLELAALRAPHAVALDGTLFEVRVDRANGARGIIC